MIERYLPKVLIIEDEKEIRKFLHLTLSTHDFGVLEADHAKEGLRLLTLSAPEVILLDLGLPDMDGLEVIRKVREFSDVPIIVLSARGQENDKILALELGADDYLTKPFSAGELIARIKVAFRHAQKLRDQSISSVLEIQGLVLDLAARTVVLDHEYLHLTPIEYKLLTILMQNAGKVVTYRQLLKEIWGKYAEENHHYLRIHTQHLRLKLRDNALKPRFIMTEPGVGYRFVLTKEPLH